MCISYESYHKIVFIVRYIDKYFKRNKKILKIVLLFEYKKLLDLFLIQNY